MTDRVSFVVLTSDKINTDFVNCWFWNWQISIYLQIPHGNKAPLHEIKRLWRICDVMIWKMYTYDFITENEEWNKLCIYTYMPFSIQTEHNSKPSQKKYLRKIFKHFLSSLRNCSVLYKRYKFEHILCVVAIK